MSTEEPKAVDPLIGELSPVSLVHNKERKEVQGRLLAPGLAITPSQSERVKPDRPRFNLTHTPTGLAFRTRMCGVHVQEAGRLAAESSVDWTIPDKDDMVAAIKATDLLDRVGPVTCGDGYCEGDGPAPPSYGVRCLTCDWEWEDEYDEGPLTLEQAREQASDHECEKWMEIHSPVTGKWHEKWAVTEAEAKEKGVA